MACFLKAVPATALTPHRKFLILLVASLTSSLIMLDTNVVAVALPTISRDLGVGFVGIQWVISAYLVTFGALLLPAGSVADRWGRRRAASIGLVVFLVASAACGLAASAGALEVSRAVQGIGGSLLLTAALAIISSTFDRAERPAAYAFWGSCVGIAMTCGPILGGVITGLFGWRWTFLINLPLCVLFLGAMVAVVPESRDVEARGIDKLGVVTSTGALFALTWGLIDGNHAGWTNPAIVARLTAAAVLLALFFVVEMRQERPMVDLQLVRQRAFLGASFGTIGYGAAAQVMVFFLPIQLQTTFGIPPLTAGFAMLPFAVPLFIAPRIGAMFAGHWGHRTALAAGLGMAAFGDLVLASLAPLHNYPAFAVAMLVAGVGTGFLNPETAKALQAQVPVGRAGMGSGIGASLRFASLNVGVAALGAVLQRSGFSAAALLAAAIAVACAAAVVALLGSPAERGDRRPRAPVWDGQREEVA